MTGLTSASPSNINFSIADSLLQYKSSIPNYLKTQNRIDGLIVGAIVFHPDGSDRMLLIQRAASDVMPNLWETPGGMAEEDRDATVLDAVARELWEESGLRATAVLRLVHTYEFDGSDGARFQKLTFEVEVEKALTEEAVAKEGGVKLDPEEHQDFLWATEDEYRAGWAGERRLAITYPKQEDAIDFAFKSRATRI